MAVILVVHLERHLESDRIKKLQKAGETDGLPVVWSRGGEDPVFEKEPDFSEHLGTLARAHDSGWDAPGCSLAHLCVLIDELPWRRLHEETRLWHGGAIIFRPHERVRASRPLDPDGLLSCLRSKSDSWFSHFR